MRGKGKVWTFPNPPKKPGASWSWADVEKAAPKPQEPAPTVAPADLSVIITEFRAMASSVQEMQAEIARLRADLAEMPKVWEQTEESFRREIAALYDLVESLRARADAPPAETKPDEIASIRKHLGRVEAERDKALADLAAARSAPPARPALLPPVKPETRAWLAALRDERKTTIERVIAEILDDVAADDVAAHTAEAAE